MIARLSIEGRYLELEINSLEEARRWFTEPGMILWDVTHPEEREQWSEEDMAIATHIVARHQHGME